MSNFTFRQLQEEMLPWQQHNFPTSPVWAPLTGITEEFGELCDAEDDDQSLDAVCDMVIYLADYCNRSKLVLRARDIEHWSIVDIGAAVGRLAHYHLKGEQGIRYSPEQVMGYKQEVVERIMGLLTRFVLETQGLVLLPKVEQVWAKVRQRDWQKNPLNADKHVA